MQTHSIEQSLKPYIKLDASNFANLPAGEKLAIELGREIRKALPDDTDLGDHARNGSAVFRFISLPKLPLKKIERIAEIIKRGSDKTSRFRFNLDLFALTFNPKALFDSNNFLFGMRSIDLFKHTIEGHTGHYGANALLVYDATPPLGLVACSENGTYPQVFKLGDSKAKTRALQAVVVFENLDSNKMNPTSNLSDGHPLIRSIRNGR